ncbi:proline-, glutamic acid- and leucine-rich protein 1 [Osmia lignaria lignaria]|uniref:proline-, glutamic acid- and leucine-rich protein 1 n=1 Tax=Osmia lignaria lignaria TaxID=1437193 RepID=UPI00402B342E
MTTITELISFFDHNSKEYEEFLQDLICLNGDIPFDIEEVDKAQNAILSTVNHHLNRSHSRYNGLLILDKILPQCSKDVLLKYCMLWISKATQVLESIHSSPQELSISCKVLGHLIVRSKDIPDIHKQVSMQNVKQLINVISNLSSEKKCGPVYYLAATLLHQYPEVCERLQVSIKKIILLQIDSSEENLVNASAKCYTLLAKATERSFKPPALKPAYTAWTYNQALICNSLHSIMDELFSNLIELENVDIWDKLELPSISEENVIQFYFKQKFRFLNLCTYLSYMLRGFGKKNSVFPHEILKVLCRGLAVQPSNLKNQNSVREQMLYLLLPHLHIALFNVLDALISGFKEQLIPFGSRILQLFLQTLQWTETVLEHQITISGNKPFRNVRIIVYKCLNSWLMHTNALSGIETISDEYLPSILKDIVPEKDRVLLTIQRNNNLSKRALKRLRDNQYEKSTYLTNGTGSSKEYNLDTDVCEAALNVLQNVFFNGGTLLKQTFFKTVQNTIIPLLYDCYLNSSEQKFYKEHPECRLLLLRVLRVLQMNPHPLVPLPTQYSLEIFEMALNDNNLYVTQEAKIALAEIEKIVHPHTPSIQLTQVETTEKEFIADQPVQDQDETTENDDTVDTVEEDMIPSSNKKLKVTNLRVDEIEKSIANNTTEETNENILEKSNSLIEEEMTVEVQDTTIVESEKLPITCDKPLNKVDSIPVVIDKPEIKESVSSVQKIMENEGISNEDMNTIEETNHNLETPSELTEANKEDLSSDKENEEEMLLQLFQDVPKDNN